MIGQARRESMMTPAAGRCMQRARKVCRRGLTARWASSPEARGIGEGIVRRLVAEGGRCLIADVQEERGRTLAGELGDAACFLRVDVTVEDEVARMVDVAVSELGGWTACLITRAFSG